MRRTRLYFPVWTFVRAVHLMLDILKKMVDRGMPVRLNVAGIGEEIDNLKAQAKRLEH